MAFRTTQTLPDLPWRVTDVRALPGDSAFLLDDGRQAFLHDSGFAFTGSAVADNVRRVLGDRPLDKILLSHSHYDHALGAVYVQRAYPTAQITAGAYAAGIFAKPTARAVMRDLDRKCAAANGVFDYEDLIDDIHADLPLDDGACVPDTPFRVIAFPGHTKCSVGYYDAENGLLLSSETLGVCYGEDLYMPAFLVGYQMTLDAFARAKTLDVGAMLLPHYGLIGRAASAEFLERSEQSARDTADFILQLIKAGADDTEILSRYETAFYTDIICPVYPIDAFRLNTSLMIALVRRELA